MAFRVGMKVVCVLGRLIKNGNEVQPIVGETYTIRDLLISNMGIPSVRLEELVCAIHEDSRKEYGFIAQRFRPLVERKADISVFTAMLNPSKQGEKV